MCSRNSEVPGTAGEEYARTGAAGIGQRAEVHRWLDPVGLLSPWMVLRRSVIYSDLCLSKLTHPVATFRPDQKRTGWSKEGS